MTRSVAVFVDGDNLSPSHAPEILAIGRQLGYVTHARVYVNSSAVGPWQPVPGFRTVLSGPKSGAPDMCLALEALEHGLQTPDDIVAVASSDGDFIPLALRLRELGRAVIDIGDARSTSALRAAFCRFHVLKAKKACTPQAAVIPLPKTHSKLERQVISVLEDKDRAKKGMPLAELNAQIRRRYDTQIKQSPEGSWRTFRAARPHLFALDPRGPNARVRLRKTPDVSPCAAE